MSDDATSMHGQPAPAGCAKPQSARATIEWQPEYKAGLHTALTRLERDLPGWWWRVGACSVSADATIGPDRTGPDAHLLEHAEFDAGFDGDLAQPATCGEALHIAIDKALAAKRALTTARREQRGPAPRTLDPGAPEASRPAPLGDQS